MTLREAIDKVIALGDNDPHVIAAKVRKRHASEWLAAELLNLADPILADLAREAVRRNRRQELRTGNGATRELMLQSYYLPGVGWVKIGNYSASDWDDLGARYDEQAFELVAWGDWSRANASMMREQGVTKFSQVKGQLPAPPSGRKEVAA